jgi:type IV pilus assembly protein PilV
MLMISRRENTRQRPAFRAQRGVGIIEVLIALLILSIGLLGMAALQVRTMRNNESAMERSMAVAETHAIADAMRADRTNAINGLFDIALDDAAPSGTTFRETVLAAWRENLENALGEDATGSVDCNGSLCEIVIQWNDSRGAEGEEEQQITTWVQL